MPLFLNLCNIILQVVIIIEFLFHIYKDNSHYETDPMLKFIRYSVITISDECDFLV